ncbi:hypothetical protein GJAV_G00106720 [Gymnothorax javanicus]|nr:hypothetical protein GJAV_G00106720 [Gymnothorax javanicus]
METSNFAHVIFQNVGKSFPPNSTLECSYTLTPFFTPHHRDWVGIFKVGWSTARDYYTFQWTPRQPTQAGEASMHQTVLFQGYYLPKDDGEFYQFCYVTHSGEVRGASTPFQFRQATPPGDDLPTMSTTPGDDLLTVEDDSCSDILVITSKTDLLEQKLEELREELQLLQQEKERLRREREEERETCTLLRAQNQELQQCSQTLQEQKEEAQRRQQEASARLRQLEQDLLELTQRGLQKETEIDCLRDRLKKLSLENDALESQLKMERDERELCKLQQKNTELENARLSAEVQMLRSVDMNKEITMAEIQHQLSRLRADKDKLQRDVQASSALPGENAQLKEQLRQKEEQLQALRQQAAMLASELRDTASARDQTMSELYRARLEADALRGNLADARAEYTRVEEQLQNLKNTAQQEPGASAREAELQQEGEELKLRLQMAAEHYKEKYRECHRLRKQLSQLQADQKKRAETETEGSAVEASTAPETSEAATSPAAILAPVTSSAVTSSTVTSAPVTSSTVTSSAATSAPVTSPGVMSAVLTSAAAVTADTKTPSAPPVETPSNLEPSSENSTEAGQQDVTSQDGVSCVQTQTEPQQSLSEGNDGGAATPMILQYPIPYPQCPAELQFGNPYCTSPPDAGVCEAPPGNEAPQESRVRTPPSPSPSWDSPVVCIQPSRNLNPPDGLEEPDQRSDQDGDAEQAQDCRPASPLHTSSSFCFSDDGQNRCPLYEVVFPPHYEQQMFEEHVESHWKMCPVCSQQFPLDCPPAVFQRHVNTHFDGHVLNFD